MYVYINMYKSLLDQTKYNLLFALVYSIAKLCLKLTQIKSCL